MTWQVTVHPTLDGPPTMLAVTRVDGGPVTQADADRAARLLNHHPGPEGPLWWASILLMAAAVAMLCAWIWAGEWRWGLTAVFPALAGLVCFGASIPNTPSERTPKS